MTSLETAMYCLVYGSTAAQPDTTRPAWGQRNDTFYTVHLLAWGDKLSTRKTINRFRNLPQHITRVHCNLRLFMFSWFTPIVWVVEHVWVMGWSWVKEAVMVAMAWPELWRIVGWSYDVINNATSRHIFEKEIVIYNLANTYLTFSIQSWQWYKIKMKRLFHEPHCFSLSINQIPGFHNDEQWINALWF